MALEKVQTVGELATRVATDPDLLKAIKDNPVQMLASLAAPLRSDIWIYRVVVGALGLTLLVAVSGAIALAFAERQIPDSLVAFGSACAGALAGLLAPSPMSRE